jgi:hypothetical protein
LTCKAAREVNQNLQQGLLAAVATRALTQQAAGNGQKVLHWWCQLAELMRGLAWRARGWHVQIKPEGAEGQAHWLVALPAGSDALRPMQALAMAQDALGELANGRSVADAGKLQELSRALDGLDGADAIVRAARALERVAWNRAITLETTHSTTNELLESVQAIAVEFERSRPQPQPGHYSGSLSTMPIPAPITPAPGEASKVLEHVVEMSCHHLEIKNLSV